MENKVLECLISRRSVRSYDPDKIPSRDVLDQILEAGMYAPTGMGFQSPIIVEVTDKATRDQLSKMNAAVLGMDRDPFYGAPVVVAVLADRKFITHVNDGTLVIGNMLNAAHALGVSSCWINRCREIFDTEEGKELLKKWGVEGDYEGVGFCILGYAKNGEPAAAPRKKNYVYHV